MAGRQNQGRLLQEKSRAAKEKKTSGWLWTGKRWNTIRARSQSFAALDMAKNIEDTGARLRMLAGSGRQRPAEGRQGGCFPVVGADRSLDLLGEPRA